MAGPLIGSFAAMRAEPPVEPPEDEEPEEHDPDDPECGCAMCEWRRIPPSMRWMYELNDAAEAAEQRRESNV